MAMTPEGFVQRLRSGKAVNCVYNNGELTGMIASWHHSKVFVLTWEECRQGDQYNEHAYTRDHRYEFDTAEAVLAFVEEKGFAASAFSP